MLWEFNQRGYTCTQDQTADSRTLQDSEQTPRCVRPLWETAINSHILTRCAACDGQVFPKAFEDSSLVISLKKTIVLGQDVDISPVITIDNYELIVIHQFTYLGSTISKQPVLRSRNQWTHWQGCNSPRMTDHSPLGEPQADHSNQGGSVQHMHSTLLYGTLILDNLCQAIVKTEQFPNGMSLPHQ